MNRLAALCIVLASLALAPASQAAKPKPAASPSILVPSGPAPVEATPAPKPAPAPTLAELTAASEAQVRARLGAPDVARREGAGAFWTYRFRSCALFVFFRADDGRPLQVTGASVGPRRRGQRTPSVDDCIAQFRDGRDEPAASDDPIQAILDQPGAPQL